MTADRLATLIHQSRMKISKLENAHVRPDLAEIMKILDVLGVTGEKWHEIVRIARDAAERGWWDAYGDAMGDRQRLYADIESGAKTIREYQPGAMPGILQTPDYTWALIEHAKAEGPITYLPERLVEARLQRQRTVLRPGGPEYEVILDEVGLRRFSVPPEVMYAQLHHTIKIAETEPRVTNRHLGSPASSTSRSMRTPGCTPSAWCSPIRRRRKRSGKPSLAWFRPRARRTGHRRTRRHGRCS
jgi:transcriptional regulator with XRE-family HTH domain